MGRRILVRLFFAALSALLVWAAVTGTLSRFFSHPERFFGIENEEAPAVQDSEEVLFDDDSTVDFSDPFTDVFDSAVSESDDAGETEDTAPRSYEFVLTPEYFNAILEKYAESLPIYNMSSRFSGGAVVMSGDASVDALAELFGIPAALTFFLPDTVPCTLWCSPKVADGRLSVTVTKVSAGSDVLSPYLSRPEILSSVESYLNDLLSRYLPEEYEMKSAKVTDTGLYIRFSGKK